MSISISAERRATRQLRPSGERRIGPRISIVLAARAPGSWLADSIEVLLPHCRRVAAELIVVRTESGADPCEVTGAPGVRLVTMPTGSDLNDLRAAGLRIASGDIVVLADEQRGIPAAWWHLLAGAARSHAAD